MNNANISGFCDLETDADAPRLSCVRLDPLAADALWPGVKRRVLAAAPAVPLTNPDRHAPRLHAFATTSTTPSGASCPIRRVR